MVGIGYWVHFGHAQNLGMSNGSNTLTLDFKIKKIQSHGMHSGRLQKKVYNVRPILTGNQLEFDSGNGIWKSAHNSTNTLEIDSLFHKLDKKNDYNCSQICLYIQT